MSDLGGATAPDTSTGTRRLDLWSEPASSGAYGDDARGTAYSARYTDPGESMCAEIAVYVVEDPDGRFGVERQSIIGTAERDDDGMLRPSDSADIEYETADARAFTTEADAQTVADRLGREDISYALNLRPMASSEDARATAIDWQHAMSDRSMSYGELADWQGYFTALAERFPDVLDEFRENAII